MSFVNKINWKKVRPINGNLIVRIKANPENKGLIFSTERNRTVATIIRHARDVKNDSLRTEGKVFIKRLNDQRLKECCLDREEEIYLIPESFVYGAFDMGELIPIGRRYLVKRLIESEQLESGIIIPYGTFTKDQTNWCEMVRYGKANLNDNFRNVMLCEGDRILISDWSMNHIEVGNMSGGYYLIIDEQDVVYAEYSTEERTFLK